MPDLDEKRLFVVSFADGNEKLLGAFDMMAVIRYIVNYCGYTVTDIIKIEERR